MVETFASDGVQLHKPNFTKMCFNKIVKESQFIIIFQTITLFSLMVHNHHSFSSDILMMVGFLKINDEIIFHLANCQLTTINKPTKDFATICKCLKESKINLRLELSLIVTHKKLTKPSI
jgi:hypothetical protein